MLSLHQLACFQATYEEGSLTRAAERLGYAQPSVSEQIRALERSLGVQLFRRVGRGVVPTTVADELRPHAERTLSAARETELAAQRVSRFETGTIRFGMFGIARLYAGAGLIADVLQRHPGVRVELVGQNSADVWDELHRGRLEAAMIAIPNVSEDGMRVTPIARDELVYVSVDRSKLAAPMNAERLSTAKLALPDATFQADDSVRILLRQMLAAAGYNPRTRVEVEDPEVAIELAGMGLADTILPRGAVEQLLPRLAPHAGFVSLEPRLYDSLAIVHRANATLSPAAKLMIELATRRIRMIAEPVGPGA